MNSVCPALTTLCHFRDDDYHFLGRATNTLFELTNPLLSAGLMP